MWRPETYLKCCSSGEGRLVFWDRVSRWPGTRPRGRPLDESQRSSDLPPLPKSCDYRHKLPPPSFWHGLWGLNLGPHASMASPLPTEPHFKPTRFLNTTWHCWWALSQYCTCNPCNTESHIKLVFFFVLAPKMDEYNKPCHAPPWSLSKHLLHKRNNSAYFAHFCSTSN